MRKRIVIVDKTRFTIALCILIVSISCVLMLTFNTVSGSENLEYKDYIVEKGDTIWKIADLVSNESIDIREVVYRISEANNIGGSDHIYPGQTIKIPTLQNN
ncbi:LysM peptidoglycan-binding domain-containing protein [Alkalibaculum sp. M08DMB]|uniref:LysM peptidoglycan-binding domain-containing protein n=1 Tax=Alkalibaculum sporogenes TaxID=2655001 RepID=A0A6A7K6T9_9FIRM|nr:LysM peptidoglycan-binding domain-containing protein [Alkalibaculum sporogenes]MPW25219.1 LysM peptidoglycan-binding domain-containing protein [Alkalibaculum sporogenes]